MPNQSQTITQFIHDALAIASKIALQYFRQPVSVEVKPDDSPVTIADREIELALRKMINERYPDHGIFGEEFGAENEGSLYTWVLDPIDGTRSFITGMPTFGTLIALLVNGEPVLGAIDIPAQNERWLGGRGIPAECNGESCTGSQCEQLKNCRMVATSPDMFSADELGKFRQLLDHIAFYRYGGDCYNYALLASGHIDLVVEADMKAYDFCALVPVVESAGGCISDWQGNALTMLSNGQVLASATPLLHRRVLDLLNQ
jgi:inositol-phosphate phosphatase/L-galactose 1-phosphate phosphatase/histidinol-phosphatase